MSVGPTPYKLPSIQIWQTHLGCSSRMLWSLQGDSLLFPSLFYVCITFVAFDDWWFVGDICSTCLTIGVYQPLIHFWHNAPRQHLVGSSNFMWDLTHGIFLWDWGRKGSLSKACSSWLKPRKRKSRSFRGVGERPTQRKLGWDEQSAPMLRHEANFPQCLHLSWASRAHW